MLAPMWVVLMDHERDWLCQKWAKMLDYVLVDLLVSLLAHLEDLLLDLLMVEMLLVQW